MAVSQTGDPTGAYYRYAFITQADDVDGGYFFPDYPKYGVWSNSYILTTRDFGLIDRYGISVYALEKNKMVNGEPNARAVQFFLEADVTPTGTVPLELVGDGLLPPDMDGNRRPKDHDSAPIVGTQDDTADYGATFDAINIWELSIKWSAHPTASITLAAQLPTAPFDSIYPCAPTSRDCLPEPGIVNPAQYPRHSVIPPAADLSARLSEFRHVRVAGDQPVGRGDARRCWRPVVRDPEDRQPTPIATAFTNRGRTPRATASIAGWAASRRTRKGTWLLAIA